MKDIIPKQKKKIVRKQQTPKQPPENKTQNPAPLVSQAASSPLAAEDKRAEKPLKIFWETYEYEYYPKSADWFWLVSIITLISFGVSIFFLNNFLFSIFIVLAGFVVLLYGAKKPKVVSFSITPRGIAIGKRLYVYEDLKSFWLNYDPPRKKELTLRSKKTFMPGISLPLGDTNPNEVRATLIKFLKEERQEESMIDAFSYHLKF